MILYFFRTEIALPPHQIFCCEMMQRKIEDKKLFHLTLGCTTINWDIKQFPRFSFAGKKVLIHVGKCVVIFKYVETVNLIVQNYVRT